MRLILIFLSTLSMISSLNAQNVYIDKTAKASFFSKAAMENIEAHNNQALGVIDLDNGLVAISILIKGFRFEKALMEEHFNENYLESDKYPKATFKGRIQGLDTLDFADPAGTEAVVAGEVTIHGEKKRLQSKVFFKPDGEAIKATTTFKLTVADYNIKIPKVVIDNIAKEIDVTLDFYVVKRKS